MPSIEPLPGNLQALLPQLEALYTDIHAHPELSMQEMRTAGIAADRRAVSAASGSSASMAPTICGTAWNTAYASFVGTLAPLLREGRPQEAALAILPWSRENGHRARFLLLNEPVALFEDSPPPSVLIGSSPPGAIAPLAT